MYVNTNFQPVCTKWLCNRHIGLNEMAQEVISIKFLFLILVSAWRTESAF